MERVNKEKNENNKEAIDMKDAPPSDNIFLYNCTECSSNIEIISLDENKIKFKCCNNHNIEIEIKEYLQKMKSYNSIILNNDICDIHNEQYFSYCFDCNIHLCKKCLETGKHSYHYKINIIEIKNNNLNQIQKVIQNNILKLNEYIKQKDNLYINNKKINNIKEKKELDNINNEYNSETKKIINEYEQYIIKSNLNYSEHKLEIEEIKKECNNKIKQLKINYNNNINNIRNKYKQKRSIKNR